MELPEASPGEAGHQIQSTVLEGMQWIRGMAGWPAVLPAQPCWPLWLCEAAQHKVQWSMPTQLNNNHRIF